VCRQVKANPAMGNIGLASWNIDILTVDPDTFYLHCNFLLQQHIRIGLSADDPAESRIRDCHGVLQRKLISQADGPCLDEMRTSIINELEL